MGVRVAVRGRVLHPWRPPTSPRFQRALTSLLDKQLLFVTGKGGVGKTTTAAALGRVAAGAGRRVLLVEIDVASSIGELYGARVGFEPTRIEGSLWACALDAESCMRAFVSRFVPSRRIADLLLKNRVARIFFESAPSVMEAVILDQLATLAAGTEQRFDAIVVDMPASGHAVKFLRVPRSMARMVGVGDLADHLRKLADLLEDPRRCELVVVTLPEEMPVNETIELWGTLQRDLKIPLRHVVVNGLRRPDVRDEDVSTIESLIDSVGEGGREAAAGLLDALAIAKHWRDEDAANVTRLAASVPATLLRVPYLFERESERALVEASALALRSQLGVA